MCNIYTLKVKLHPMRSSGFHGICKIKVIREHSFLEGGGGAGRRSSGKVH